MVPVAVVHKELSRWGAARDRLAAACALLCRYLGERDLRLGDW